MAAVAHPIRPHIRRNSPLSTFNTSHVLSADVPGVKRMDVEVDSDSDDEPPPAIKFSKVTQALLADVKDVLSPTKQAQGYGSMPRLNRSVSAGNAELDTPSRAPGIRILRRSSPPSGGSDKGHTPSRVVHIGSKSDGSAKRSVTIAGPYPVRAVGRGPTPETYVQSQLVTPAQAPQPIRIVTRSRAGSNVSQDERPHPSSISRSGSRNAVMIGSDTNEKKTYGSDLNRSASRYQLPDTASRYGGSTTGRSRHPSAEPVLPPGSQRIKRAPIGTGTFLRSGPVRRGFRRRDSDENVSPTDEPQNGSSQPSASSNTPQERSMSRFDGGQSRSGSFHTRATSVEPISVHDYAHKGQALQDTRPASRLANSQPLRSHTDHESRPPSRQASRESLRSRQLGVEQVESHRQNGLLSEHQSNFVPHRPKTSINSDLQSAVEEAKLPAKAPSSSRATYRYAQPKIHADAREDQENIPPPTFKRNREQEFKYLGKPSLAIDDLGKPTMSEETPVPVLQQEHRKALGIISGNTPHRPAPPPPPKMSVLDAATSTAGASTTKSRKKRQHMVVNGKIFTQMGKIGKGGSCDVYCVMAENYKTFALKRVKLEDCDENAVKGYKGEIDLLKKLAEADRVVRLFDWELNEEKQELLILMEKGDTDLNRNLTLRLNGNDAQFDGPFTRYYWREMLECVQAVHDYDIVHSDLKPANFLLVQGRLKLIDFGIANAIDTDNTCNVHRDSHVGTPNYMSPESITDNNASETGKDGAGRPLKKDMRIGKSSDVWSLGCILYQMTYGRPPFAHIQNQITRIMAITNPKHVIEFPETGVGGARIPASLIGTLRRCLNRDPERRPLIKQLLSDADPYLNPEGTGDAILMTEDLLGQIINKVLDRCRDPKRGIPNVEEAQIYPRSFMSRIREMQEARQQTDS